MAEQKRFDEVALILNALGSDVAMTMVDGMSDEHRQKLESQLSELSENPPTKAEIDNVINDFQNFFDEVVKSLDQPGFLPRVFEEPETDDLAPQEEPEEQFAVQIEPEKKFVQPNMSGNLRLDLNRLHPYQVARALRHDNPKTISIVLRNLTTEHAAKTIEFLPEATRSKVVVFLAETTEVPQNVLETILEATRAAATKVEKREEEDDQSEQLISLMRSLPKSIRSSMLEQLVEKDEEFGTLVRSKLYRFEDLVRVDDRDIQKVLAGINTDSLSTGLQNADPELVEKLLGNMSKRARQSIEEEMEFKQNATETEIEYARQTVVDVLIELEENGEITVELK